MFSLQIINALPAVALLLTPCVGIPIIILEGELYEQVNPLGSFRKLTKEAFVYRKLIWQFNTCGCRVHDTGLLLLYFCVALAIFNHFGLLVVLMLFEIMHLFQDGN